MHGPEPVGWLLAALCAGTGAYCVRWLSGDRPWWRQVTAAEAAMGLGMAAMALLAGLTAAFVGFFAALALWGFLLWLAGVPHGAHHAVEAAAMAYMALAMSAAPGSHAAHGPAGVPWLTGALLAYFAAHALATGRALVPSGTGTVPARAQGGAGPTAAECGGTRGARPAEMAAACRVTLSTGMVAMLATL